MSKVSDFMNRLVTHTVTEFPIDCWNEIKEALKRGGFQELMKDKAHFISCLFTFAAYIAGKLSTPEPDVPVIGSNCPSEEDFKDFVTSLEMATDVKEENLVGGFIQNLVYQRLLALLVSYLISLVEDNDKVQEVFDEVIEWIRANLIKE